MRILFHILAVLGVAGFNLAQEVVQVRWSASQVAPEVELRGVAKELLPAFRIGLGTLPEASVVAFCLSQPQILGLSVAEGQQLQKLTSERYALMEKDAAFRGAPSALPYCFSETRTKEGLATVYLPARCTDTSSCIVFLHGYGGSFLWYLHILAEAFPDHLIICPAYGMSCGAVPGAYVHEAVGAVEKKLGFKIERPTLMGLSAGGFGAFLLYAQQPLKWRKMICLAAYPRDPALQMASPAMDLRFMAGGDEFFVLDGSFSRGINVLKNRGARVGSYLVPGSGHFFLLQNREETLGILRQWLAQ